MTPEESGKIEANQGEQGGQEKGASPADSSTGRADRRRSAGRRRRDAGPAVAAQEFDPTSRGDESGEVL